MSLSASDEQTLWQRGREGEPESFGLLFDLHRDRVFRHAYRLLLDHSDAEDATAVAFLEMWRHRARVREVQGSVLPWLLVTATNAARNLHRARSRYRRLLASLPREDVHPSAEDVAFSGLSLEAGLASAVRSLSPVDAQMLSLIALEGFPISEAAHVLGISAGAARVRLHRIRTKLQHSLGHATLSSYLGQEATT